LFSSFERFKKFQFSRRLQLSSKAIFSEKFFLLCDTHDERDVWNIIKEKYPAKSQSMHEREVGKISSQVLALLSACQRTSLINIIENRVFFYRTA
jgi:hypothetical protein